MIQKAFLFLSLTAIFSTAHANHWPQLRGPDQTGVITGYPMPTEWDDGHNIKWKVPSPGMGWSSPVVWGDRIFISSSRFKGSADGPSQTGPQNDRLTLDNEYTLELLCMDKRDGRILWRQTTFEGHPNVHTHSGNPYAAETPVTDGEHVIVYYGTMGLHAFTLEGEPAWKRDFGIYEMDSMWGTGSSPMIHEGTVYLQIDNEDFALLVALDSKTGEELWRVNREEKSNWSSPIIWKNHLRSELITQGSIVRSYNPSNGELYWQMSMQGGRNSSLPVGDNDRLIIGNEKRDAGGFLFSVRAGASGDISLAEGQASNQGVEWVNPNGGIAMSSPLLYQNCVYAFERRTGMVSCYDAKTGDVHYYRKHLKKAREFWSSPWAYNGEVYCIDGKGITHVLKVGPLFNEVRQNVLDDQIWATPAITEDSIIIRGIEYIYAVEGKGSQPVVID